jgi:glycosyl transferase family 87
VGLDRGLDRSVHDRLRDRPGPTVDPDRDLPARIDGLAADLRAPDRPGRTVPVPALGVGTIVKVQPGLVIAWLVLRVNLRAAVAAIATIAVIGAVGFVVGLGDLPTFLRVLSQISSATDLPSNYAIGASAHRLGLDLATAGILQAANTAAMLGLVVVAARWLPKVPGYLIVVTISQILSPIVWTHYALALLLPVAWLLERRQWWILVVPLSHLWLLIAIVPEQVYTLPYYIVIVALLVVGWRERAALADDVPPHPAPLPVTQRAEPA